MTQARDDASKAVLDGVAQLRLSLVEPAARGLGAGQCSIDECERFARQAGYRKIVLGTPSELLAARRLCARTGYRLTGTEAHRAFGRDQIAETWELAL